MTFRIAVFAVLFLLTTQSSFAQQWPILGNETAVSSIVSTHTTVAVVTESGNDISYVAFCENGVPKVKKRLTDGTWTQVGANLGSNAAFTRIYADAANSLYVAYIDFSASSKLAIQKFNSVSGNWEPMNNNVSNLYASAGNANGSASVSQYSSTQRCSMAFDSSNTPYVTFSDAGMIPYVKKFDGTAWVTVGTGAVASGYAAAESLVIDSNNVPWLAYCSLLAATTSSGQLALYRYDSGTNTWVSITVPAGATSTATTGARHTSLAISGTNTLCVAYFNTGNTNKATAAIYDKIGGGWTFATLAGRDSPFISLINDSANNVYCSFQDYTASINVFPLRVRYLAAGTTVWTELKDPAVTRGVDEPVNWPAIAVANGSTVPFVVYTKANLTANVSTPIVRKYAALVGTTPAINSFTPALTATTPAPSTAFTITGSNFTGATAVSFGGNPAASFTVVSATSITGTTSATALADFNVSVTTSIGTAIATAPSALSYASVPSTYNGSPLFSTITATSTLIYSVSPALPAGLSINTGTGTISGSTTTAVGSANYIITASNNYGSTTTTINFATGIAPSAFSYSPVASASYTTGTAITPLVVVITPGTGTPTYTVSPLLPAGFVLNSTTGGISGTPTSVTASTAYTVTATTIYGFTTRVITFSTATPPTWNGTAWSNTTGPTASLDAIIDGDYSIATPFTALKLTVNAGKTLTIKSGTNITVQNQVINNGSLVVENNANLIQVLGTTNTNTGNIVVNRNSSPLLRLDYTLWSSPVAGQKLADFSPLTSQSPNRFYTYDSTLNLYAATTDPITTNFTAGAGYLIRMPNTADAFTPTAYAGVFTGVPNNGDVSVALSTAGGGYNLVGNPYPSTINLFTLQANNSTVIGNTFYMWRKTNGAGTAYCSYVPTTLTTGTYVSNGNTQSPAPGTFVGNIQTGQGFFVVAATTPTGPLVFKNAQRVTTVSSFFKTKEVAAAYKVWLNATNATGDFSQMAVTYFDGATQSVDAFDGKYINDSPFALTSNINNEEYTIQGRPAFDASDIVALNFKTAVAGNYTIAIDHSEGVFAAGQDVFLKDNTTGTETNLKAGAYTFTAAAGTANSRFSLSYQKTLETNTSVFSDNYVTVYKNKGTLYVNSANVAIANIKVYDVQGRVIAELKNVKSTSASISNLKAANQILVVKITLQDNKVVTKKVVN